MAPLEVCIWVTCIPAPLAVVRERRRVCAQPTAAGAAHSGPVDRNCRMRLRYRYYYSMGGNTSSRVLPELASSRLSRKLLAVAWSGNELVNLFVRFLEDVRKGSTVMG